MTQSSQSSNTSPNKQTIESYIEGFRTLDRERILSCLTDDIEWTSFGQYHIHGKDAYNEHITEPGFSTAADLSILRLVEEGDTVMAEIYGEVRGDDGQLHRLAMAEVFRMRDNLICERRAFVVPMEHDDY